MRIQSAVFEDFPPFRSDAEIHFPTKPADSQLGEVQFLVGGNGSGKTRLLSLLCAACGNRSSLASRLPPETQLRAAVVAEADERLGVWSDKTNYCNWLKQNDVLPARSEMFMGTDNSEFTTYGFTFDLAGGGVFGNGRQPVSSSQRRFAMAFSGTNVMNDEVVEALKPVSLGKKNEQLVLKSTDQDTLKAVAQSLVNMKMTAAMDAMQGGGQVSRCMRMVARLEEAISSITGRSFAITVTHNSKVNLKIVWGNSPPMLMVQAPDGLRAILGWLAAAVARLNAEFPDHEDPLSLPVVILIDEPEAHLHPKWQRYVLPALQRLLPNSQIIAATHSAFVISSVNEGWIHLLQPDDSGAVRIEAARPCSRGDSHLDVVEDILGVKEWYDPETEEELARFRTLRDGIVAGKIDGKEELQNLAAAIASRSPALNDIMGREMAKITRQLSKATTP
jgi:ABC-type cobalamin/Fe3+-siderophores transport system ATPase subunit